MIKNIRRFPDGDVVKNNTILMRKWITGIAQKLSIQIHTKNIVFWNKYCILLFLFIYIFLYIFFSKNILYFLYIYVYISILFIFFPTVFKC